MVKKTSSKPKMYGPLSKTSVSICKGPHGIQNLKISSHHHPHWRLYDVYPHCKSCNFLPNVARLLRSLVLATGYCCPFDFRYPASKEIEKGQCFSFQIQLRAFEQWRMRHGQVNGSINLRATFKSVGERIQQQLLITTAIEVAIIVTDLADTCHPVTSYSPIVMVPFCRYTTTLAQTQTITLAAQRDVGPILNYPKALIKQFFSEKQQGADMVIKVNSRVPWFASLTAGMINPFSYDLECTNY